MAARLFPSAYRLSSTRANMLRCSLVGGNLRRLPGRLVHVHESVSRKIVDESKFITFPPILNYRILDYSGIVIHGCKSNIFKTSYFPSMMLRLNDSPPPAVRDDDILGANEFGIKFLIDKQRRRYVPVESLRGKIVALYFPRPILRHTDGFPCFAQVPEDFALFEFYNSLKRDKPDAFEMIYVPPLPKHEGEEEDPYILNAVASTFPCLSVPVDALPWRLYLNRVYNCRLGDTSDVAFIDTRDDNKVNVLLPRGHELDNILRYGSDYYPFTAERAQHLQAQLEQLGRETSIQAILGSDSRDYLIDRHSNRVPISSLQDKDVLIYFHKTPAASRFDSWAMEELLEIYTELQDDWNLEIVSVNYDYKGGNGKQEKLWKDRLAKTPWLSLPYEDKKIWLLRSLMRYSVAHNNGGNPVFLIKPKGESPLDPYGFPIYHKIGCPPYTRKAAAKYIRGVVKQMSFDFYMDEASRLGLDFSSLIRNKANGGTEHVSLSTILEEGKSRGILFLFTSLESCSPERLKSLIDVYSTQDKSSSPFEVIFVSIDKDTQSFDAHFSTMPWPAFPRPLTPCEYTRLAQKTTLVDFNGYSNFLAYGPDRQFPLQIGLLTKSFENCEFPFVSDAESLEHVTFCLIKSMGMEREADGTLRYEGDGWWRGIEYKYVSGSEDRFSESDDEFFG